ncbi:MULTISPECIES: hypothetical protein [unclassified Pseudoalteromonas]|uniref:hypothetical protein n=1 Tax=unclassified Pseudoalteromonas TaxID=194690 RepID=UPI00301575B2
MAWIKIAKPYCLAICLWLCAVGSSHGSDTLDVFIRDDVLSDYQRFVGQRDVSTIRDFSHQAVRRDVVDMIIAQQALRLGGFKKRFTFRPGFVNFRDSNLLLTGQQLLYFDSFWRRDIADRENKVFVSDAVILAGQYYAGVYHAPHNSKVAKVKSLAQLQQLSAVSSPRWKTDWQTLQALELKKVHSESDWTAQARMVSKGWVDFMMMPLQPKNNNRFTLPNIELVANPHVVILLDDSRHFLVSRAHPDGKRAFTALQKGLQQLRQQGAITKAYQQAGLIPDVTQYQVLQPAK